MDRWDGSGLFVNPFGEHLGSEPCNSPPGHWCPCGSKQAEEKVMCVYCKLSVGTGDGKIVGELLWHEYCFNVFCKMVEAALIYTRTPMGFPKSATQS